VEEAIELAQAEGVTYDTLADLLIHIWKRKPGEPKQEVGGIGVTLLAYCETKGISADLCEMEEIERIISLPSNYFQARQNIKASRNVAMKSQGSQSDE